MYAWRNGNNISSNRLIQCREPPPPLPPVSSRWLALELANDALLDDRLASLDDAALLAKLELTDELDTACELTLEVELELLAGSSAGGVPLNPTASSWVSASTRMPF